MHKYTYILKEVDFYSYSLKCLLNIATKIQKLKNPDIVNFMFCVCL